MPSSMVSRYTPLVVPPASRVTSLSLRSPPRAARVAAARSSRVTVLGAIRPALPSRPPRRLRQPALVRWLHLNVNDVGDDARDIVGAAGGVGQADQLADDRRRV